MKSFACKIIYRHFFSKNFFHSLTYNLYNIHVPKFTIFRILCRLKFCVCYINFVLFLSRNSCGFFFLKFILVIISNLQCNVSCIKWCFQYFIIVSSEFLICLVPSFWTTLLWDIWDFANIEERILILVLLELLQIVSLNNWLNLKLDLTLFVKN